MGTSDEHSQWEAQVVVLAVRKLLPRLTAGLKRSVPELADHILYGFADAADRLVRAGDATGGLGRLALDESTLHEPPADNGDGLGVA